MENRSLGRRLDRALLALQLKAQGAAVDPSKDLISTGKTRTVAPPDYGDEMSPWLGRSREFVALLEQAAGDERPRVAKRTRSALLPFIRGYEGYSAAYVAAVEGCSTSLVEKVRASLGLDAGTGFPKPKALTSRVLPEADGDDEVSSVQGCRVV